MVNLPQYILDIGTKVAWTSEFDCFRTFCHYTSIFYSIHPGNDAEIEETTMVNNILKKLENRKYSTRVL